MVDHLGDLLVQLGRIIAADASVSDRQGDRWLFYVLGNRSAPPSRAQAVPSYRASALLPRIFGTDVWDHLRLVRLYERHTTWRHDAQRQGMPWLLAWLSGEVERGAIRVQRMPERQWRSSKPAVAAATGVEEPERAARESDAAASDPAQELAVPYPIQRLRYQPTSGAELSGAARVTTTVIGAYQSDMKHVVSEMGNVKSQDFGPKPGGLNVLNVPDHLYVNPDQFWDEYNRPWLQQAIDRGDRIVFATEPTPANQMRFDVKRQEYVLTGFGRECRLLEENGLVYDAQTRAAVPKEQRHA